MKLTNKTAQAAAGAGFLEVRKFLHAGQQSYPRTLDLEADPAEELRITPARPARWRPRHHR